MRRQWEAARKVNIHGATVTFDPAGPIAEAAWAKQRLGRATQALPNGYCGLPVQQSCPHANACLTCPMFLTTGEFLPQHREQRQQTLQLITAAEARGQQRLAEMNRQVLHNLDNIITALDDPEPAEGETMRADNSIHLATAARQRHEHTRAKAIAAMHELDRAGAMLTFESVARHAGVSRSWIYTQTDLKDEIGRLRAQRRPEPSTPIPARQRASDDSLRRRLEIANRRNRELADENQRLRRQLVMRPRPTPRRHGPALRTDPSQFGNDRAVLTGTDIHLPARHRHLPRNKRAGHSPYRAQRSR